jgi:hypothetical protein
LGEDPDGRLGVANRAYMESKLKSLELEHISGSVKIPSAKKQYEKY